MTAMWMLPAALRARIALVTLVALLLVPVGTSSLRGLTHLLACREAVDATLAVSAGAAGPTAGSAASVTREDVEEEPTLCGGLVVDLELARVRDSRADVVVAVTNRTTLDWRGTVELEIGGTEIPVDIGRVPAGTVARDTVELRVEPDRSYEITGTLLLGP